MFLCDMCVVSDICFLEMTVIGCSVCARVHQVFGCLCGGPSIRSGDGIMLCVWDVCCSGCWCIAGVCSCV